MKNYRQLLSLIILSTLCSFAQERGQEFYLPAEWEPQERVHLAWFGSERRDSVLCRVIEALQPEIPITLNIPADSLSDKIKAKLLSYGIDTSKIHFHIDPFTDFWTRDPIFFIKNKSGLKIVCFDYSLYGVYPDLLGEPIPNDVKLIGEYDERLAEQLQLPVVKSDFVFEAGGIESNGNGTFMIIKEMAIQRNPGKTIREIENELYRTLGAKKIVWLKEGLIEDITFKNYGPFYKNYFGGGANRHIDELCRFVNDSTVILPYISEEERHNSPVDSINYYMIEENMLILQNAETADGKKLTIYRVPVPAIELLKHTQVVNSNSIQEFGQFGLSEGDTIYRVPAASYLNFFISNDVVLVPKYWNAGLLESQRKKDEEAMNLFLHLFPEREVIQIYTLSINRGGGGIHCMTHEQPAIEN